VILPESVSISAPPPFIPALSPPALRGVFSRAQLELHAASLAEQPEALYACAQGNAAKSLSRSKAEYKNGNPIY